MELVTRIEGSASVNPNAVYVNAHSTLAAVAPLHIKPAILLRITTRVHSSVMNAI